MKIIGIDPGLQRTGWGVIAMKSGALSFVACGTIKTDSAQPLDKRLQQLHHDLKEQIILHTPQTAAIEETFVSVNGASTLKLGQARGALMLTLSLCNLPVAEYAATLVKKSIVGAGRAEKNQVAMMVQTLLSGCGKFGADAMDALAIAICHANHSGVKNITEKHLSHR